MKLITWNVNGIRAIVKKDFKKDMLAQAPDVLSLQETKATVEQTKEALGEEFKDYFIYGNEAERKGYSGTAVLSKEKPLSLTKGIGDAEHDQEGRVLCLEFKNFFLVNVYVPNSGSGLKRIEYRAKWDCDFLNYCLNLEKTKPVVICGDLNVAHREIDLKNPKANYDKNPGFTQIEIDGMDGFVNNGFVDAFRHLYPDEVKYSWWSYRAGARARNVGWRIDYFLVSPQLTDKITDVSIHNEIMGSDHCPVSLQLA